MILIAVINDILIDLFNNFKRKLINQNLNINELIWLTMDCQI